MEMVVRDARLEDASAVAGLLGELGYPTDAGRVKRRLERLGADPASRMFVAEIGHEVAGFAGLHVMNLVEQDELACVLTAVVVSERHRRRGIGTLLVQAVEEEARARGSSRIVLGAAEQRSEAHAFYERLGYEHTGRRFVKALAN